MQSRHVSICNGIWKPACVPEVGLRFASEGLGWFFLGGVGFEGKRGHMLPLTVRGRRDCSRVLGPGEVAALVRLRFFSFFKIC